MNRTASTKKEFSNRSKRRVVTANVDGKSILEVTNNCRRMDLAHFAIVVVRVSE
jgi:hypothetical protein